MGLARFLDAADAGPPSFISDGASVFDVDRAAEIKPQLREAFAEIDALMGERWDRKIRSRGFGDPMPGDYPSAEERAEEQIRVWSGHYHLFEIDVDREPVLHVDHVRYSRLRGQDIVLREENPWSFEYFRSDESGMIWKLTFDAPRVVIRFDFPDRATIVRGMGIGTGDIELPLRRIPPDEFERVLVRMADSSVEIMDASEYYRRVEEDAARAWRKRIEAGHISPEGRELVEEILRLRDEAADKQSESTR